ncbi:MAG: putative ATPase [Clostridium sp.]|jgi:predicted ATPase
MKIKSLYVNKYKALKEFEINFNEDVSVIIGENGTGKTSILELIYNTFIENETFFKDEQDFSKSIIKIKFTEDEIKELNGLKQEGKRNKIFSFEVNKGSNNEFDFTGIPNLKIMSSKRIHSSIVYSKAEVNYKNQKIEAPMKPNDFKEFATIIGQDENNKLSLKQYIINEHYKDLEDLSVGDKPFRIDRFRKLYNSFFEEKEFIGVKDFEPVFKVKSNGEVHSADQLSAGEKQIFFRGGALLQLNLENSIILIDEPELSLHPEWQQKILDFYRNIGNNNQIIIATHSPHIVSSCKKEEIRVLIKEDGRVKVEENIEETYGWTVEQLLLSVFQLESIRNPEVQKILDRFKALYVNNSNLNAKEQVEMNLLRKELEKYLDPEDPALSLVNLDENSNKLEAIINQLKTNKNKNEIAIENNIDKYDKNRRNGNA